MGSVAFGLGPVIRAWARENGARTLLGPGGDAFLASLDVALADDSNAFLWQLQDIDLSWARNSIGWYDMARLDRCRYTNWELWVFAHRPDVWPRTSWWMGRTIVANPVETWL